jgi:hypothetical protein
MAYNEHQDRHAGVYEILNSMMNSDSQEVVDNVSAAIIAALWRGLLVPEECVRFLVAQGIFDSVWLNTQVHYTQPSLFDDPAEEAPQEPR